MIEAPPKWIDAQPLWLLMVIAFVAMFAQDVLETVMVVLESNHHAYWAGVFDMAGTLATLASSGVALMSIIQSGFMSRRSLHLIAAVLAADFLGTTTGVFIADAIVHH